VAAEGMFGNLNPLGDGPGRSLADHGARVPEVLPAAELDQFFRAAGRNGPEIFLFFNRQDIAKRRNARRMAVVESLKKQDPLFARR